MPLSDLADIQISTSGAGLSLPGFGVAMILGAYGKSWSERSRTYSKLAGGVDVDFASGTPEYLAAAALFGQNPHPTSVMIGRGILPATQIFRINVPATLPQQVDTFAVVIDGVTYTTAACDSTPTQAEVIVLVAAALAAVPGLTRTSDGTGVILTGVSGAWHRVALAEDAPGVTVLGVEETTADPGVATDLGQIATENGDFYAVVSIYKSKAIMTAAAVWVEANERLMVFASQESAIITTALSGGTDVATTAKAAAYARTAIVYDPDNGIFADAGLLGRCLPETPGSETWADKTLAIVPARNLTGTHLANLRAKYCGWVYSIAGRNLTQEGKVAAGEWIDTVRARDALKVDMQGRIVPRIANSKKIPYTDKGATILEGEMRASLKEFERRGFIAEGTSDVTMPKVATQSSNDRSNRYFPGATFTGILAGAIHKIAISGALAP
jgi:hypothetical protein